MSKQTEPSPISYPDGLRGKLLVAMPTMPDPRFARSVIYVCSHGPGGAMGLIINRTLNDVTFRGLLQQLDITIASDAPEIPVHFGGPVETGRGFVLHSGDFMRNDTMHIDENVSLSASLETLQAIANGIGPRFALMALGYAGWEAGQLENEIKDNGWLIAEADDSLLFDRDFDTKWKRALVKMGITPSLLSVQAGHA